MEQVALNRHDLNFVSGTLRGRCGSVNRFVPARNFGNERSFFCSDGALSPEEARIALRAFYAERAASLQPMQLDFEKLGGLVPAIIQDELSGRVLMLGFMNEEAFHATEQSGFVTFFSRTRGQLWLKGESSGHRLLVRQILTDCDADSVLVKVEALGPGVCHQGYASCFFRRLENDEWIEAEAKTYDPALVYGATK